MPTFSYELRVELEGSFNVGSLSVVHFFLHLERKNGIPRGVAPKTLSKYVLLFMMIRIIISVPGLTMFSSSFQTIFPICSST